MNNEMERILERYYRDVIKVLSLGPTFRSRLKERTSKYESTVEGQLSVRKRTILSSSKKQLPALDLNYCANKSNHPIQNPLLLITEPRTHDE
jgi:hypothetical protein